MQGRDTDSWVRETPHGCEEGGRIAFQHEDGEAAAGAEALETGHEAGPVVGEAVLGHLHEGALTLDEGGGEVVFEGVVPGGEGGVADLEAHRNGGVLVGQDVGVQEDEVLWEEQPLLLPRVTEDGPGALHERAGQELNL